MPSETRLAGPDILLVNPWIHDFAAYDFWAKPLGLLSLGAVLEKYGARVSYIDCLDRFHKMAGSTNPSNRCGRGPYLKTLLARPAGLEDIPRNYSRYGIKPGWFQKDLEKVHPPDLIFVTSLMTYWYPGVIETIAHIKNFYPDVPLVLGGIYAGLCHDHALACSGADLVVAGPGETGLFDLVKTFTNWSPDQEFDPEAMDAQPFPAFHLQRKIAYIPILTSRGCPFSCAYCASGFLWPKMEKRDPEKVVEEIVYWHNRFGVKDFAFYDDALLVDAAHHVVPMLKGIIRSGIKVRFHTPNALHIRHIGNATARLMFKAGFHTIRLGLETAAFEERSRMDKKVTEKEFLTAVNHLKNAGFKKEQVGAYLLAGLPDQEVGSVETSIKIVKKTGVTPVIAHYTPIPHTAMWDAAVKASRYDIASDPIFTNNAVFPCMNQAFSWKTLSRLKKLACA